MNVVNGYFSLCPFTVVWPKTFDIEKGFWWWFFGMMGFSFPNTQLPGLLEQSALEPRRNFAVRFQGRENGSFETFFAVDEHALMLAKLAKQIGFDFVFLHLRVRPRVHSARISVGRFLDLLLSEKIGALDCTVLVCRFEYHSIPQIEREHFRFFVAQRRNE